MMYNAFERYADFIKEYIYRKQWQDLREVQVEACEAILDTENNVIISSGTASGKTEAALFPILTLLEQNPSTSISVLYISPLKALINDQFNRLDELLEESYIPVWAWHGDISGHKKTQVIKKNKGILQITPESLEALIMKKSGEASRLFSDLKFIIIDEIHAFVGTDRGIQLQCILSRIEDITNNEARRIGLSATLNDYESVINYLTPNNNKKTEVVGVTAHKKTISLCVNSFKQEKENDNVACNEFIYDNSFNSKCIIFTNSRANAEKVIMDMKEIALNRNEKDVFFVHHGSISKELRLFAENTLKNSEGASVCAATLTLELGIDIGDLDITIQYNAPHSCSSFVQRLGRSGRRTGKSKMIFVHYEYSNNNKFNDISWELLKIIATIQLYLEEKWVEPFYYKSKPFSVLAHQTISVLISYGSLKTSDLARKILTLPPFSNITPDEYKTLLVYMVEQDYLEKLDNGEIIVGLKGEKIANFFEFYSVFSTSVEYEVYSKDYKVGVLDECPREDDSFVLAGHMWQVDSIDYDRKKIYVHRSKNNKVPRWFGGSGDIDKRIIHKMKSILSSDNDYSYILESSKELLVNSRVSAIKYNILDGDIMPISDKSFYLSLWTGTKELKTIEKLLNNGLKDQLKIQKAFIEDLFIFVSTEYCIKEFVNKLKSISLEMDEPNIIIGEKETLFIDKYDYMVHPELLKVAKFNNAYLVNEAIEILKNIEYIS